MKFAVTANLTIRSNSIHDNLGPGIWVDTDNINTLYEGNVVMNNYGGGISHEVSYAAIIRNNTVCGNWGAGPTNWLWGAEILIQNSQNVQVYGNTVEVPLTNATVGANGIGIVQQSRGTGAYGPYLAINNSIHNNTITYLGGTAASGEVADYDLTQLLQSGNNLFDYNAYHLSNPNAYYWNWGSAWPTFAGMQQLGQELHSTDDNIMPPPCSLPPS